jgi:transposase
LIYQKSTTNAMSHSRPRAVYLTHGITNATSENINAKIQWVKYTARGFRNLENFKNAIYFHCGGQKGLTA